MYINLPKHDYQDLTGNTIPNYKLEDKSIGKKAGPPVIKGEVTLKKLLTVTSHNVIILYVTIFGKWAVTL